MNEKLLILHNRRCALKSTLMVTRKVFTEGGYDQVQAKKQQIQQFNDKLKAMVKDREKAIIEKEEAKNHKNKKSK